ncbi:ExbD/TolR family protein [Oceanicoccus sagamiensis]|uniref:Biopolymer transporter ExbD n=1 Tax=Oceanicoccus sagamiensis TaxID=716816 RepID=A0A1X9N6N2_9GAMM|nr:biopolymer transporter ExbD [Oceanicoccus sagamiensis]ARN73760.1 hypothetical protein BST96_06300 [Oceanicoccus sagamiensis]
MIKSTPADNGPLLTAEITPLIDIVFIVIVFLLITANTPLLSLPIDVPDTDTEAALDNSITAELTVTITDQKPYWHIDQQQYNSWAEFKRALLEKTADNNKSLTIATDKDAPSEPLLKLLSFLNKQAFSNAQIIMEQPGEQQ